MFLLRALIGIGLFCLPKPVIAQEVEEAWESRVRPHGYGNWSYGITDHNHYLNAKPTGRFDAIDLALGATASLTGKLTIFVSQSIGISPQEARDTLETELDFAMAQWAFSDLLKLQAGQVKQPYGIYTTFRDVGTLRPLVTLPQGLYGGTGFIAEAYKGIGFSGRFFTEGDWGLGYDLYGGQLEVEEEAVGEEEEDEGGEGEEEEVDRVRYALGLRVVLYPPLDGLRVGISGYTGQTEAEDERRWVAGAHLEYVGDSLLVRGEYTLLQEEARLQTFYIEAAYTLFDSLQLTARYDGFQQGETGDDDDDDGGEELPEALTRHQEIGVGATYYFDPGFALKLSCFRVIGNRFAGPQVEERKLAQAEAEELTETTNVFMFGTAFSF